MARILSRRPPFSNCFGAQLSAHSSVQLTASDSAEPARRRRRRSDGLNRNSIVIQTITEHQFTADRLNYVIFDESTNGGLEVEHKLGKAKPIRSE